ncbi:MAG: hypothetical protein LBB59_04870 [Campylobacteraceae bacterium]|jgi:uncharacterized membrane protein|nr:hypothetical protein [Campylobacteraceae bacterium]
MRFLLVNTNPAVSKLVNASLNRIGLEAEEVGSYNDLPLDSFIAVIVDSDSYSPSHVDELLALSLAPSLIYLKQQNTTTPQGFAYALTKPFLPTDFISFIVSILKRTPELERFITPKAKEFISILPEEGKIEAEDEKENAAQLTPEEESLKGEFINFNFYDDLQKKEPIFSMEEAAGEQIETAFKPPKIEPDTTNDISFNLSEDISELYSLGDETEENKEDVQTLNQPQKTEEIKISQSETTEKEKTPSGGDFVFSIKDSANEADEAAKEPEIDIAPLDEPKAEDKVNFDFDIMDKMEEAEMLEAFSPIDNFLKEPSENENKPKKVDGFEELAKEFDDLIKTPNKQENTHEDAKLPSYAAEEEDKNDPFVDLNEKEMKRALQDGGLLPQSAEEAVKHEIQSVVQDSVRGLLQGNILRDILKGLKMNITITFEDKE